MTSLVFPWFLISTLAKTTATLFEAPLEEGKPSSIPLDFPSISYIAKVGHHTL